MKKIFTTVYAILVAHGVMSQSSPCSSCFDEMQSTRIITDPSRYSEIEPCTLVGQEKYKYFYQKNQFRWYEGNEDTWRFKSPDKLENGIYYVHDYLSPFIAARQSSGQVSHLQFLLNENFSSDNLPQDGWELIKQDFGFWNYNNSQPDVTSAEITAISPEIATQLGPRNSNFPDLMSVNTNSTKSISYMILYNRFTATLRVIGISNNTLPNNLMYIRLEQIFRQENINNGTPGIYMNGNFASYQNPNQVLSEKTRTSSIGTYAKVLQGQFFFGDFQMAYDPCICQFQGQMLVTFQPITQSNFNAIGAISPNPTSSISLLTSVWDSKSDELPNFKYTINSNLYEFKTTDDLLDKMKSIIDAYPHWANNKKNIYKDLADALKLGASFIDGGKTEKAMKIAELALNASGFGMFFFDGFSKNKVSPSILTLTGTATTPYPVVSSFLSVPGSKNAYAEPMEYAELPNPLSPIYNESLGIFALFETPTYTYYDHRVNPTGNNNNGSRKVGIKFNPNSLKYAFNPKVKVKSHHIKGALFIKHQYSYEVNFQSKSWLRDIENVELNTIKESDSNWQFEKRRHAVWKTPFLDLNCLGKLTAVFANGASSNSLQDYLEPELKLAITIEFDEVDSEDKPIFTTLLFTYRLSPENTNVDITADVKSNHFIEHRGGIEYADRRSGIPNYLNPVEATFNTYNATFYPVGAASYNSTGYSSSYDDWDMKIFAHNNITINNSQKTDYITPPLFQFFPPFIPFRSPVTFISGDEITLNPGAEIEGRVELITGNYYFGDCNSKPIPQTRNEVALFCSSGVYKAKEPHSRYTVSYLENVPLSPNLNATSLGYPIPNPANTTCRLPLNLAEAGKVTAYISNAMGMRMAMVLEGKAMPVGEHNINISTESLEPGVYYITVQHEGFKQARRFVVVR